MLSAEMCEYSYTVRRPSASKKIQKRRLGNQKYQKLSAFLSLPSLSHPKVSHVFGSGARLPNVGCFCLEKKERGAFINLSTAATNWKKSSRCLTSSDAPKSFTRFTATPPSFAPEQSTQVKAHTAESSPKTYTTAFR